MTEQSPGGRDDVVEHGEGRAGGTEQAPATGMDQNPLLETAEATAGAVVIPLRSRRVPSPTAAISAASRTTSR